MTNIPDNFEVLFNEHEIEQAIDRIATQLNVEFHEKDVLVVCVMHGGLPLTWDLMKRADFNLELDFIRVRRYAGTSGGMLHFERDFKLDVTAKHVLIVDDVLDRGVTLAGLYERLSESAEKVYSAVLCDKRALREVEIEADFVGLTAPDRYLIGRGMDMNGRFRQLPAIYAMK